MPVDGIDWHARYEEADQCLMRIQDIMGDSDPSDEDDDLTEELWALGIIPGDEASERVQLLYDSWKMLRAESAALRERLTGLERDAQHLVTTIDQLMESSEGVVGLHLNGDIATWSGIGRQGHFSAWLGDAMEGVEIALEATTPMPPGRVDGGEG